MILRISLLSLSLVRSHTQWKCNTASLENKCYNNQLSQIMRSRAYITTVEEGVAYCTGL